MILPIDAQAEVPRGSSFSLILRVLAGFKSYKGLVKEMKDRYEQPRADSPSAFERVFRDVTVTIDTRQVSVL